MATHLHQIYYSPQTQADNDPGFLPLDNLANERPDWREYWPMRRFLLTQPLHDDDYYGFFSPKFKAKTGLDAAQAQAFVVSSAPADVISFSPFFDQAAFPLNIFEQALAQHPDIETALRLSAVVVAPGVDPLALVMDASVTIFCNYFVAKPVFWRHWLASCERLYALVEAGDSELARALGGPTRHDGGSAPVKVFVIERVASLLLALKPWRVVAYNPLQLPYAVSPVAPFKDELCLLDALKAHYRHYRYPESMAQFFRIRASVVQRLVPAG